MVVCFFMNWRGPWLISDGKTSVEASVRLLGAGASQCGSRCEQALAGSGKGPAYRVQGTSEPLGRDAVRSGNAGVSLNV